MPTTTIIPPTSNNTTPEGIERWDGFWRTPKIVHVRSLSLL